MNLRSLTFAFLGSSLLLACGDETSAAGGGGTGAGPTTCDSAADCAANPCEDATCENSVCGTTPKAEGTPVSISTPGDCMDEVCDGAGSSKLVPNDMDLPDPDRRCVVGTCDNGTTGEALAPLGTVCDGDGVCNKYRDCVQCYQDSQCTDTMICAADKGACAPDTCGNGMQDNDESDVDCGGASCPACADGAICAADGDCLSGNCMATCTAPTCMDNIWNGTEADTDCGGNCPEPCNGGNHCFVNADCASNICNIDECQ